MMALFFILFLKSASAAPFRVLIFPHQGTYTIPQGSEKTVSKVKVTSNDVCHEYAARLNAQQVWEKTGNLLSSNKTLNLSAATLRNKNTYFECSQSFKVNRDSPLVSYSYDGNFVAIVSEKGSSPIIQLVNLIDAEKYIQGVVPAEVGKSWPLEALKAQAVAARTFAWFTVLSKRMSSNLNYDLDDTVQYQAYSGSTNHTPITDEAVLATSNLVMKYQGEVIKSYFSADSGGMTESAKNAFGQPLPYCESKVEQYDITKTKTSWVTRLSLLEIGSALNKKIKSIEVLPQNVNESGRVDQLTITTQNGQISEIPGTLFRRALKLRSTMFQIKSIPENGQIMVEISGKGYGHGVGMAQIGAREYALQLGWTFDQIVKFYYTGITLEPVNDEQYQ